ncbi:MAG: lipoprotein [Nitrospinaceae bacterium]|nr:lipoprotein [Nitrospinaceae bacterium]
MSRTSCRWIFLLAIFIGITACGIKGPPLAPNDEPSQSKTIQR